ncbi:cupin domain-containing protein [Microvirga tunisiensis]|uniref:Cupin domain-containing protein n=1 Tax=Pannonibacter tanglangensis TaxID=2750084 RepID=A0A7X5J791_9HYPH|nr:cupin domain-containing protein [Pannonibacter sp. XCT-53]NBN77489.1 cupin domain-containing protein [Pannonibacter sp. XCT-53]
MSEQTRPDAQTPAPVPLISHLHERPAWWVVGDRYTSLLAAEETGGSFSLFEFIVPAGRGSPPHIHHAEHETFVIISGEVEFTVAGTASRVGPGGVVFGARGVAHNFRNVGESEARMIVICTPGGLERFFAAAGVPTTDRTATPPAPTQDDKARMIAHAPAFQVELLLPGSH